MTKNFVEHRLLIDYSLTIGSTQWVISWLLIDWPLINHQYYWCHWLLMSSTTCSYVWHIIQLYMCFVQEFVKFDWSYLIWILESSSRCVLARSCGLTFLISGLEWLTKSMDFWPRTVKGPGWVHCSLCTRLSRNTSKLNIAYQDDYASVLW